jgi:hypothetical protein
MGVPCGCALSLGCAQQAVLAQPFYNRTHVVFNLFAHISRIRGLHGSRPDQPVAIKIIKAGLGRVNIVIINARLARKIPPSRQNTNGKSHEQDKDYSSPELPEPCALPVITES